jgi:hypothetical protein
MKRPLRRQWYDAVDAENAANQLLVAKRRFLRGGCRVKALGQAGVSAVSSTRCLTIWMQKNGNP